MKLYLTKNKKGKAVSYDITKAVTKYTWSGSLDQASRSLDFSIVNAPQDKNLSSIPSVTLGDFVKLKDGSDTIFFGMVYTAESTSEIGDVTLTCYDLLYHFTKSSWSRSFRSTTAEAITKTCCNEVGVKTGKIEATKVRIEKLLIDSTSIYDTILKAYKKASKVTGKKYMVCMSGDKLDVIEKGYVISKTILTDASNITKASVTESATDLVNRVNIIDETGKRIGVVSDAASVSKYGTFSADYEKEKGVDSKKAARSLFQGATQELTLEAVGDVGCISGYAVKVVDGSTGMAGKYWIISDSHTFENGVHTMSLTLSFKNVMGSAE